MSNIIQLQKNEEIISEIRRHPASLVLKLIGIVIVVALAFWFWFAVARNWTGGLGNIMNILMLVVLIGGIGAALFYWYRYYNDVWLVTNQRLVDSTKTSPVSHQVSTADLQNVQDISIVKKGVFATMFNYGDVLCQTASATGGTFNFRGVANPQDVLELIDNARDEARARRAG
jgi:hypothetical protein